MQSAYNSIHYLLPDVVIKYMLVINVNFLNSQHLTLHNCVLSKSSPVNKPLTAPPHWNKSHEQARNP